MRDIDTSGYSQRDAVDEQRRLIGVIPFPELPRQEPRSYARPRREQVKPVAHFFSVSEAEKPFESEHDQDHKRYNFTKKSAPVCYWSNETRQRAI